MQHGSVTVVTGPMFAGKTETLIRMIAELPKGARYSTIKPILDTRYSTTEIVSHSGERVDADIVPSDADAYQLIHNTHTLFIDEAQFFSAAAARKFLMFARMGTNIVAAGLDLTSGGEPFGPMPLLMAFADKVVKLRGTCAKCAQPSSRTQRLAPVDRATTDPLSPVYIGGAESYEPRCTVCFDDGWYLPPTY